MAVSLIWIFLEPAQLAGSAVSIGGRKGHHLARVLRVRPGERGVAVCQGREYHFEVSRVAGDQVDGRVTAIHQVSTEPAAAMTLLQAVLPNPDFDAVVEASTALGVTRIVPVLAERSVARPDPGRRQRWQAIAESAAEQSHRGRLPEVAAPTSLERALAESTGSHLLVLHPQATTPLAKGIASRSAQTLAIGPEGGWTDGELARFDAAGGRRVSLGPRILRARLAPIAAIAILMQHA